MDNTPQLSMADWIVTGNEVIAWINDLEFFDISFDVVAETFALRINHVALVSTIYLGESDSFTEAVGRARAYANADDHPVLCCTHGRTLVVQCPECAEEAAAG